MENETIGVAYIANAITAKTQFAEIKGRKIAYRSIGNGKPIILCNRFRGILDTWDPAFLDELAKDYKVIIFDYSGIGLSTGSLPTQIASVAEDVTDLARFLQLKTFAMMGWSYGGLVAQTVLTHFPELITHTILIGTAPPGKNEHAPEDIFFERSSKLLNNLDDEIVLFFEPASESSRDAAELTHNRIAQRTVDLDVPVPEKIWTNYSKGAADFSLDTFNSREKLGIVNIPILVISGDHDLVFPVENWYDLTRKLPNLQIIMLPQAGHGPQHQYLGLTSQYIRNFIENTY